MQKCLAVNAWSLLLLGVLLPLYLAFSLERRARARFYASHQWRQDDNAARRDTALSPLPALLLWQPKPVSPASQPGPLWLNLYLASCAVWTAVSVCLSVTPIRSK